MTRSLTPYLIPLSRAGAAATRCRLCGTATGSPAHATPLAQGFYCSKEHAAAAQFEDRCRLTPPYYRAMTEGRAR